MPAIVTLCRQLDSELVLVYNMVKENYIMTIYLITNLVNGKWYVGQTIRPLEHRWERHLHVGKRDVKYHLYKSIKKYGVENFKIQKIEECDTVEEY